jgi:Ca-activated chloride channel family protein
MHPLRTALFCLLPALSMAQPAFRADVRLVNVGFSVRDAGGTLVDTLGRDDFEVLEDGVAQKIAFFGRSADTTLNLGLVVDMSGSQAAFLHAHRNHLKVFLDSVLAPADRAFLVCFGNHPRLVAEFTPSARLIVDSLEAYTKGDKAGYPELGPAEVRTAGTALYDSLFHSVRTMFAKVERGRRALVIFSDGEDNSSAHTEMEAIEEAQAGDVLLFPVRYTELRDGRWTARNKYGRSALERMARDTGGAAFDAAQRDLASHFKEIGDQLRSSYELGYHSSNPGSDETFRKISIRVKQPGLTVRAKTGYYAR